LRRKNYDERIGKILRNKKNLDERIKNDFGE